MYKLNLLLNENTLINFKLVRKLILRYRSHFFVSFFGFLGIFLVNYYYQPIRYSVNVSMQATSTHVVSRDLSSLLPNENASVLNVGELKLSFGSLKFLKNYAKAVSENENFAILNFGLIGKRHNLTGREIKFSCRGRMECIVEKIAGVLQGSFNVEQSVIDNRFTLTITANDKKSAEILTPILLKVVEENRIGVKQALVFKEIKNVSDLIEESRTMIQKMDGYTALENQEKLQNDITDAKEKIKLIQFAINSETANVSNLESRLNENKKTTSKKLIGSRENLEHLKKKQNRLLEIRQNISILSNVYEENRSEADREIIKQLKRELKALTRELPNEVEQKSLEGKQSFMDGQAEKSRDFEFEYVVAKNKLETLKQNYEDTRKELDAYLQEKIANEGKVIGMKSDLEFLKNLENKLMSLRLLSATLTSDLFIEESIPNARGYRQATILKIFLFSISIAIFLYFTSLILRYLSDDTLYDVEEIHSRLGNLDFLGEAPRFD